MKQTKKGRNRVKYRQFVHGAKALAFKAEVKVTSPLNYSERNYILKLSWLSV